MLSKKFQNQAQTVSMMILGGIAFVLLALAMGVNTSPTQANEQVNSLSPALGYTFKAQTPEGHSQAAIGQQQVEEPTNTPTKIATATSTPSKNAGNICQGVTSPYDLAISQQTGQTVVLSGAAVTYTVIVANCGILESRAITIHHTIPSQLIAIGWTFENTSVVATGTKADWIIPNLAPQEVTTATVTGLLVSDRSCPIKNKIEVISQIAEPDKSNNMSETVIGIFSNKPCTQYGYLPVLIREPSPTPTNTPTNTPTATATNTPSTPTLTPTATGTKVLYKEEFSTIPSDSSKKWFVGSSLSGFCNTNYVDGFYETKANKGKDSDGKTSCWGPAPKVAENLRLVYGQVEAKMYHRDGKSDATYGIYMNGKGGDELYLLRIWPNTSERTTNRCSTGGDWEFDRVKGGTSRALGSGRCHPSIKAGTGSDATNLLKIVHKRNGKLSVYINNVLIDSFTDSDQLTAGYGTGIYVRTDKTKDINVRADDFTLYEELN